MTRIRAALLATASLCTWTWAATAHAEETPTRPPIAAFAKVPAMTGVVLSPNGQLLAWIDSSSDRQVVEVLDLAGKKQLVRMTSEPGLIVRSLEWADDDVLLIHNNFTLELPRSRRGEQFNWVRISALNVRTGKNEMLLHKGGDLALVSGATVLAARSATPGNVVMSSWGFSEANYRGGTGSHIATGRRHSGWTYNVYNVDTKTGTGREIAGGTAFTVDWVVDSQGQPVARAEWEPKPQRFAVLHRRSESWKEILRQEAKGDAALLGLTTDGTALWMLGTLGHSHQALWRLPVDGSEPQLVLKDDEYDITGPLFDPYTRELLGVWRGGPEPQIIWLDEKAQKRSESLRKTFGGQYAHVVGRSADSSRVLVDVSSATKPSIYYLIDYQRRAADIVGEQYPGLVDVTLGEVRTIVYKARDGYEIPAYLTLPPGLEAQSLPLVALPHGGPQSRDVLDFDWLAQFIASRGYAVIQPQFRGSTGLGEAHARAGYRQWGGLMQDDVTDAVKAMVEQGIADPDRVCIAGASYGGYAALAGAAFTPELYACSISINGVSDLPIMLRHEKLTTGSESNAVAYWSEHIGSPYDQNVVARSPARSAQTIRAPVLVLHGSNDTVVPLQQAQIMVKALQGAGKKHKFVELPGEDHWLSRSESRIKVLTEMEAFLDEHLSAESRNVARDVE